MFGFHFRRTSRYFMDQPAFNVKKKPLFHLFNDRKASLKNKRWKLTGSPCGGFLKWRYPTMDGWLVVGPPLWKIWTSIGMMRFPIYGKIKNVPNHQQWMVYDGKSHLEMDENWGYPSSGKPPQMEKERKFQSTKQKRNITNITSQISSTNSPPIIIQSSFIRFLSGISWYIMVYQVYSYSYSCIIHQVYQVYSYSYYSSS